MWDSLKHGIFATNERLEVTYSQTFDSFDPDVKHDIEENTVLRCWDQKIFTGPDTSLILPEVVCDLRGDTEGFLSRRIA